MYTPKGRFAWYELMTTDVTAAAAFYTSVVGWTARKMPPEAGMEYTVFEVAPQVGMAGLMAIPAEASGTPPMWVGYIHVDDIEAHVEKLTADGAKVLRPISEVPGMLWFALLADPQGAVFMVFQPHPQMGSPERPVPPAPGTFSWHELMAADWEEALAFYGRHFGWTRGQTFPMGPMGTYQIFDIDGQMVGGMMNKMAEMPVPYWRFCMQVEGIDAAAERIKAGGGTITTEPMQVPGGMWTVSANDPQGAGFSLLSLTR